MNKGKRQKSEYLAIYYTVKTDTSSKTGIYKRIKMMTTRKVKEYKNA